jgi:hypothetical protein
MAILEWYFQPYSFGTTPVSTVINNIISGEYEAGLVFPFYFQG